MYVCMYPVNVSCLFQCFGDIMFPLCKRLTCFT